MWYLAEPWLLQIIKGLNCTIIFHFTFWKNSKYDQSYYCFCVQNISYFVTNMDIYRMYNVWHISNQKQKKVDIFKIFKDEVNNVFDTNIFRQSKQEISSFILLIFFFSTCEITRHYKNSEVMWYISCLGIHVLCLWCQTTN
jgi:hypothetical protein